MNNNSLPSSHPFPLLKKYSSRVVCTSVVVAGMVCWGSWLGTRHLSGPAAELPPLLLQQNSNEASELQSAVFKPPAKGAPDSTTSSGTRYRLPATDEPSH